MPPRINIPLRAAVAAAVATVAVLSIGAAPASAAFHLMKIREVFAGAAGQPQAQFVELQMYAGGQSFVQGHRVRIYDAAGLEIGGATFPGSVANGSDQSTILVATQQAADFFDVTPDLLIDPVITAAGGKVCFDDIDCVSWGTYSGSPSGTGTPFRQTGGLAAGLSAERDIAPGDPARLDPPDDTGDSAADFDAKPPTPRTNAGGTGEHGTVTVASGRVRFGAATGAADRVALSGPVAGLYTLRDTGRAVRAGAGCTQLNATDVRCPSSGITGATLEVWDDTDIVHVTAALASTILGGTGDDTLTGGGLGDSLNGGDGTDTLNGGGGNDRLDGARGPDVLTGGPNIDTAYYAGRSTGVVVSLDGLANDGSTIDAKPDGTRGDKVDTENVTGGAASDRIIGNDLVNVITGGGGADFLSGLGNADTINAKDGIKDSIFCGSGTDKLSADVGLDSYTPGTSGCEQVSR